MAAPEILTFGCRLNAYESEIMRGLAGDRDDFEIPITQEELAGLVGASRERVNKAIASFLRLGWIEQNDRQYRILKRRELEIRST